MKANEAPEKLYILFNHPYTVDYTKLNKRRYDEEVEYTRTDAFIEKACKFIREGRMRGNAYIVTEFGEEVIDFLKLAEDFENYMKGE